MSEWHKTPESRAMTRERSLQIWISVPRYSPSAPEGYSKPWYFNTLRDEQRKWIESSYLRGASLKAIGAEIGRSAVSIHHWLKIWGVPRRKGGVPSSPSVEIPSWVPPESVEIYDRVASEKGEEAAASYVRKAKAGALKK